MRNPTKALIIFARKPLIGKVKTRLAASIGDEKALQIYLRLLEHTRAVAKQLLCDCFVFLTEPTDDDFWEGFFCEQQKGNALGEKMQNAFEMLFNKGYDQCIIIGSDCPGLEKEIVESAFTYLLNEDVVIGPAVDGGYYLLGIKMMIAEIFNDKEWSTHKVLKQTIKDIEKINLTYRILPFLNDVDEEKDVPADWLKNLDIK